jgi:hypothetical protein
MALRDRDRRAAAAGIVGQAPGVIESAERIDRTIITGVIEFA